MLKTTKTNKGLPEVLAEIAAELRTQAEEEAARVRHCTLEYAQGMNRGQAAAHRHAAKLIDEALEEGDTEAPIFLCAFDTPKADPLDRFVAGVERFTDASRHPVAWGIVTAATVAALLLALWEALR